VIFSHTMDIRQLESLCKVAELGSFSLAAEALFLTQPTVSAHINSLERALGAKLFDRMGRKVVLTPTGEVLYRYARQILALREEALNALQDLSSLKGEVLTASSTIPGEYLLPRLLAAFNRKVSPLRVKVTITDSEGVLNLLLRGDVELGFVGMKRDEDRLEFFPIYHDSVIIVAPRGHPLAGKEVPWEDFKSTPLVMRERGSGTRRAFERGLKEAGYNPSRLTVGAEFGSSAAVKEAVKAGLGVGVISDLAVKGELGRDLMEVKVKGMKPISRTFYLVKRRGKTLTPAASRLVDFTLSEAAQ